MRHTLIAPSIYPARELKQGFSLSVLLIELLFELNYSFMTFTVIIIILTSHGGVLHWIMPCMEGILVCCQVNAFDISYFLHCKKWWKKIIHCSLFSYHSWFYEPLLCSLSAASFSRLKRMGLVLFPSCVSHFKPMIILAGFLILLNNHLSYFYLLLAFINIQSPTQLRNPLSFIS